MNQPRPKIKTVKKVVRVGVSGHPFDQGALLLLAPTALVPSGDIEVVLQQFAVHSPNRLCHHIRIGVDGHQRIEQPRFVLRDQQLLNGTTGFANPHGVLGLTVEGNELLFDHCSGVRRKPDVVVHRGSRAAGERNGITGCELGDTPPGCGARAHCALAFANAHSAAKIVDQLTVPELG